MMEVEEFSDHSSLDSFSSHEDDTIIVAAANSAEVVPKKALHHNPHIKSSSPSMLLSFAQSVKLHEWLLGFGAIVAIYLVNGSVAAPVCALSTNLPAVVHSYRIITEEKGNLHALQVTLCYWILLGTMTVLDCFLGNAYCYYFGKFILMSAVYAHVVAKSRSSTKAAAKVKKESHALVPAAKEASPLTATNTFTTNAVTERTTFVGNEMTAPTQMQTLLTPERESSIPSSLAGSVGRLTSKHSSLANYLQWTKKRDDPASDISSYAPSSTLKESPHLQPLQQCQTSSASTFREASMSSTAGGDTILRRHWDDTKQAQQNHHHHQPHHLVTSPASSNWSETLTPMKSSELQRQPAKIHARPLRSAIQNSSIETLPCFENDISSDPYHTINFSSPFMDSNTLKITNVASDRIMWALKTNALDRIIATPTCGVLAAGNTLKIKMAIRDDSDIRPIDSSHDRMAIDYVFVPETCVAFDSSRIFAKNANARRKSFDINYAF